MATRRTRRPGVRLGAVRTRVALGAAATLVVAFVALSAVAANTFRSTLQGRLADEAAAAVDELAAAVASGDEPGNVSWQPAVALDWRLVDADGVRSGRVTGDSTSDSTPPAPRNTPDSYQIDASGVGSVTVARTLTNDDGTNTTLIVDATNDGADLIAGTWFYIAVFALPLVALGAGIGSWVIVGRALRPVEQLRVTAERVGVTDDISTRLPEVDTGDEIAALGVTLNAMLDRLEAASAQQRSFVSDAGHELRTPIATLRTLLETPGGIDERGLELARDTCVRLSDLSEDLFALAVLDEWGLTSRVDVDLDVVIDHAAAAVAAPDGVTIDVDGRPARCVGDPAALERVCINLIANAARWATSRVTVSCDAAGGRVTIDVDDDGPGVPAEQRQRIFARFSRLDPGRSRTGGGTGLGLAIVARAVAAHGGTVAVDDSPLGGARFHIDLPADTDGDDNTWDPHTTNGWGGGHPLDGDLP